MHRSARRHPQALPPARCLRFRPPDGEGYASCDSPPMPGGVVPAGVHPRPVWREIPLLEERLKEARVAIVEDGATDIEAMSRSLSPAVCVAVGDTRDRPSIVPLLRDFRPDVVLVDLRLPATHAGGVMDAIRRATPEDEYLPVLSLARPLGLSELRARVHDLLRARDRYRALRRWSADLESRVHTRTLEVAGERLRALHQLAQAAEAREDVTGQHTKRVGQSAGRIAAALGWAAADVQRIRLAASLHDIGKVAVPDGILLGDGPLSTAEFEIMKTHCRVGAELLAGSTDPLIRMAADIALTHHERWDGLGYPDGLAGAEIPLAGRIVAVADTYDALLHPRPYKRGWRPEDALAAILSGSGTRFDPEVVAAFTSTLDAGAVAVRLVG